MKYPTLELRVADACTRLGDTIAIAAENLWRASLIDAVSDEAVPFAAHLDGVLALVAEDADALGCKAELDAARIVRRQCSQKRSVSWSTGSPTRRVRGEEFAAVIRSDGARLAALILDRGITM